MGEIMAPSIQPMFNESSPTSNGCRGLLYALVVLLCAVPIGAEVELTARVPVETIQLENGMRFLLVARPEMTTVAAGWVVEVGSADEEPGQTGLSHLLEHLMFKGTRNVGTRDIERERILLDREDRLQSNLRALRAEQLEVGAKKRTQLDRRVGHIEGQLNQVQAEARSISLLGQFSLLYSRLGAVGLNAHTLRDLTFYYVTVPAEKLEAWFWLESDRLLEPVFREFYKELDVLHEERRLRIDSNPTGSADEQLKAEFWDPHPYAWDPQGAPEDLERLTREAARGFFRQHYTPGRITAALVGDFDISQARELAVRYFGRIQARRSPPRREVPWLVDGGKEAERTLSLECDCPPQVQVLYPSAAFGEPDSRTLEVMAAVLNGRSGRLYRSMVLGDGIAFSASTLQSPLRQAGYFSFRAETKGDSTPETLLVAWDREVARLQSEPVTAEELLRAKNRLAADSFRRLKDPSSLLAQLLVYQGMGDWSEINTWPRQVLEIDADEIQAAARRYLEPNRKTVGLYNQSASGSPPSTATAGRGSEEGTP
jgi:predicted Zn-dependent peptidase